MNRVWTIGKTEWISQAKKLYVSTNEDVILTREADAELRGTPAFSIKRSEMSGISLTSPNTSQKGRFSFSLLQI